MQKLLIVLFIILVIAIETFADVHVLVLTGNIRQAEFTALEKFTNVDGTKVTYTKTSDRNLPGLEKANILWIGQGEICENSYFLDAEIENKIKNFVKLGGIVISIGQDSDDGRPCETGWLTAPVLGIERGAFETFVVTNVPEVGDLFKKPNEIKSAHFDDAWTQPDKSYIVLATINNGVDIGIALLRHGKGWYILTSLENEDANDVTVNSPLMENLIHYAVKLMQTLAVEHHKKLSIYWGMIKFYALI